LLVPVEEPEADNPGSIIETGILPLYDPVLGPPHCLPAVATGARALHTAQVHLETRMYPKIQLQVKKYIV